MWIVGCGRSREEEKENGQVTISCAEVEIREIGNAGRHQGAYVPGLLHGDHGMAKGEVILGLKILVGVILGVAFISVGFWVGVIIVYGAITLVEMIGKWITK